MQQTSINRSFLSAHADGSRINQNIRICNISNISNACNSRRRNHILRARFSSVDDGDVASTTPCKSRNNCPRRTACTYDHSPRTGDVNTCLFDCIATAVAVGIGPNQLTIGDRNRIYRASRLCRLIYIPQTIGGIVQHFEYCFFVRHGDRKRHYPFVTKCP